MAGEVRVRGLKELNRALVRADRDVRLGVRNELRAVAEPVRAEAQTRASGAIRNIGVPWSRMRTGVTAASVYVAPKERGVKSRGQASRKRKNLAPLLMERAMQPALDHHANEIEREFDAMLGRVAGRFSQ